jgi:hypothetical protein
MMMLLLPLHTRVSHFTHAHVYMHSFILYLHTYIIIIQRMFAVSVRRLHVYLCIHVDACTVWRGWGSWGRRGVCFCFNSLLRPWYWIYDGGRRRRWRLQCWVALWKNVCHFYAVLHVRLFHVLCTVQVSERNKMRTNKSTTTTTNKSFFFFNSQ